ncbi:tetratricopeptide repeat protein [Aliiroseovarius sp. PrR006]|uniref:tetratricopeptide repeat protein n=1 Tax=Aliiroseovarius sp. PrR006 TaxID=2706883 RepID=UPI0013D2453D|nr:sel1 repeat family protein [Aliiroseovarius sp. PrR006]NDW52779.1 sel1 repeat family protein [Aliiroseovarius sp. PrR006]
MTSDEFGTHNPEELTLHGALERLEHGESHPMEYAMGYFAAKAGLHDEARKLFEGAVDEYASPQGMTWLSWMADNGLAGPEDPEAAAEWDRKAAEAGSEVGMFNHGLNLLRGRGVARNEDEGRRMIESAAAMGQPRAQHLIDNDYDLESVTPDADSWKYNPLAF